MNRASKIEEVYPENKIFFDTTLVPIGFNFDKKSASQTYQAYAPMAEVKEKNEDKTSKPEKIAYYF